MSKRRPSLEGALQTVTVLVVVAGVLATFHLEPATTRTVAAQPVRSGATSTGLEAPAIEAAGNAGAPRTAAWRGRPAARPPKASTGAPSDASSIRCAAGANGGSTDIGVTGKDIKLGATVVESGIGASFLGPVRIAMVAVKDRFNREGGICGRQLQLSLIDDGWEAERGCDFIKNLVEDSKVFALAVNPSSEGLRACNSYIRERGVPVIGTDGMLIHQYTNRWIWPVATSTISQMHIMAKNVCDRYAADNKGSCKGMKVGIVYDSNYHFGVEGAYAFNRAVKRLTGKDIAGYSDPLRSPKCQKSFCGVTAGQPSYASQVQEFNSACASAFCDFVALLLEPPTALVWVRDGFDPADLYRYQVGGAQPLFNRDFAVQCRERCNGMWVWSGYSPPVEQFASQAGVQRYEREVRQVDARVDTTNAFVEGGWIGMNLVVEALKRTGPALTRRAVAQTLDSMALDLGVSSPLQWAPGRHFSNPAAHAFSIQYKQNFAGWRYEQTGFVRDPWLGQDIPAGER